MNKIFILAPDSFKESMSAEQACFAMQRGIQRVFPTAMCMHVPMADGGEGTVDALVHILDGKKIACVVEGPLPDQSVKTYFGLFDNGRTAVIEMAKANGIHLIEKSQRNPLHTSTYGTGQMIKAALDLGVDKIIMGLGGSVTNDAGSGMAQALGVKFLNANGSELKVCGGNLNHIQRIDMSGLDVRLNDVEILVASDVINPLCGKNGASAIFGPQKGATPEMVKLLDDNLSYFANLVHNIINIDYQNRMGAGAAGGLGFALMAFIHATIQSGAKLMIELTQLNQKVSQADYVFTGEGCIDFQTKLGKTPWAVAQVAKQFNKPVIAFAGHIGNEIEPLYDEGFTQIISINEGFYDLEKALKNAEENLEKSVYSFLRTIK
ncbi:glycerate kinase [Acinetobacter sp. ANC 4558]|uniref:glycerate kinase family protein n=1 Tax=Acinetobacter sp. ANC 4558 TaxID=1977876 RepID=UPI000A32B67D|nr:glycerate kinase [Acinetobacter sp. ANC 4558]OTG85646.1 glycerate kinase [Acinetobacter sp. ANC 4558]